MITVRRSKERGHANHGWLDTYHTFSFANYYDPKHMGYRALRVINEDVVDAAMGFGEHPHDNMEIITYVLSGALAHRDSTGNSGVIRPGDVQVMSAGSGLTHSEFNGSKSEPVHLLQIWIYPAKKNVPPRYDQKTFPEEERKGRFRAVVSGDGRDGSLTIGQDAVISVGTFEAGQEAQYPLAKGRGAWVQVARGTVKVNGTKLVAGDGAAIENEAAVQVAADEGSELLLFDLP